MQIKRKIDAGKVLDNFASIADWDALRRKHYFVFEDRKRGGQWTLMKQEGSERFSRHGRGEGYSDERESFFGDRDGETAFLWENRAAFNAAVRNAALPTSEEAMS